MSLVNARKIFTVKLSRRLTKLFLTQAEVFWCSENKLFGNISENLQKSHTLDSPFFIKVHAAALLDGGC